MKKAMLFVLLAVGTPAWSQTPQAPATQAAPATSRPAVTQTSPAPQTAPGEGEVEVAPIRCWWKTDNVAIRIGERFTLTLTCGVLETSRLTVVANTTQLDPGAVQITPFEVVSGVRHEDIVTPLWRYFQYEYQVRLLSEGFFGQDVSIPALPVTYSLKAAAGGGSQGRDQSYILPALPMRVMSLVPRDADDIRDAPTEGFAPIELRRSRATTATVAGGVLFAVAGLLLALGALRAVGKVRQRRPSAARPISPVTVLGRCLGQLAEVKAAASREGWSPELARRALALVRVAGAMALGRPVTQTMVGPDAKEREGELVVRQGVLRPRRAVVSAATTANTIDRLLGNGASPSPASRALLEQLRGALQTFSVAGYGRSATLDTIALDAALADSSEAARQLRRRSLWPMSGFPGTRTAETVVRVPSLSEERS